MASLANTMEFDQVRKLAHEYQEKGYEVLLQPSRSKTPKFLGDFQPDLIALSDEDKVVVEVKTRKELAESPTIKRVAEAIEKMPGWRLELVLLPAKERKSAAQYKPLPKSKIRALIQKANKEIASGSYETAFPLLWIAAEAAVRSTPTASPLPESADFRARVKTLYADGFLSASDLETLEQAYPIRNTIVHGYKSPQLRLTMLEDLKRSILGLLASSR